MLKYTIDYFDFNGKGQRETLYFNITEFEILDLQAEAGPEGIHGALKKAIDNEDAKGVLAFVKLLVHNGYGVKSVDGKNFRKSNDILQDFLSSAAYSPFIMDLFLDVNGKLVPFVNELIPSSLIEKAEKLKIQQNSQKNNEEPNPYEVGFSNDAPAFNAIPAKGEPTGAETITPEEISQMEMEEFLEFKRQKKLAGVEVIPRLPTRDKTTERL